MVIVGKNVQASKLLRKDVQIKLPKDRWVQVDERCQERGKVLRAVRGR